MDIDDVIKAMKERELFGENYTEALNSSTGMFEHSKRTPLDEIAEIEKQAKKSLPVCARCKDNRVKKEGDWCWWCYG